MNEDLLLQLKKMIENSVNAIKTEVKVDMASIGETCEESLKVFDFATATGATVTTADISIAHQLPG